MESLSSIALERGFNKTAATGTAGTLYGVVDFSSSRAVISGDTLQVTVTVTAASA